jgi:TolA-binding protein
MKNYTNFYLLIAEAKLEFENHKKDWGKSHQAQVQLSAMQSQVSKLNNRVSQLTQVNQQLQQQAKPPSKKTPKAPAAGTTPEQQEKAAHKAANELKFAPPKDGEPHERVIDGKPMIWCTKCCRNKQGRWTFHSTKEH